MDRCEHEPANAAVLDPALRLTSLHGADDIDLLNLHPYASTPPSHTSAIRVFVSSTFRDLASERQVISERCYPELKRQCHHQGVQLSLVDLRWGITESQAASDHVVDICLREVRRCSPHFIGVLGRRYGWIPTIAKTLIQDQPWVAQYQGRSITELEILQALHDRPPHSARTPILYQEEGPADNDKLDELIAMLRQHKDVELIPYSDTESLASLFTSAVERLLDPSMPDAIETGSLSQETARHWRWAQEQAGPFICPAKIANRLQTSDRHLLISGPAKSGRTRLLAHQVVNRLGSSAGPWLTRRPWYVGGQHKPIERSVSVTGIVLYHFCDADTASRSPLAMMTRWTALLGGEPSEDPFALRHELLKRITSAALSQPVHLIIDGIDRLATHPAFRLSDFLIPRPGVTTIASLDEDSAVSSTYCERITLKTLAKSSRATLLDSTLYHQQARELGHKHASAILDSPHCTAAEGVSLAAMDLSRVQRHEDLDDISQRWRSTPPDTSIHETIIDELRSDRLTAAIIDLVACCRDGIDEDDLDAALGDDPDNNWINRITALHAARPILVEIDGRIRFRDPIIADHTLATLSSETRANLHQLLITTFKSKATYQAMVEVPWHTMQAQDPPALAEWLMRPGVLCTIWSQRREDAIECGAWLDETINWFPTALATLEPDDRWAAIQLLRAIGRPQDALHWAGDLKASLPDRLAVSRFSLSLAIELHDPAIARQWSEQLANSNPADGTDPRDLILRGSAAALNGDTESAQRALAAALSAASAAQSLSAEMGAHAVLGQLAFDAGQWEPAMDHFRQQHALATDWRDPSAMQKSLSNINSVLLATERYGEAITGMAKERTFAEENGDRMALFDCIGREAMALIQLAKFDEALVKLDSCRDHYDAAGDMFGLAATYHRLAILFGLRLQQSQIGIRHAEQAHAIAVEAGIDHIARQCLDLIHQLQNQTRIP